MAYQIQKLIEFDCETTSEKDLSVVGAHRYSRDPSTVCYFISFTIGEWKYQWKLGQPIPIYVIQCLNEGYHTSAHNREFDVCIWNNHMVPRYGVPPMPIDGGICTAAVAAYNGMPRQLSAIAKVREYPTKKDSIGSQLMKKMLAGYDVPVKTGFTVKNDDGTPYYKFKKGDNLWRTPWVMDRVGHYADIDVVTNRQILDDPWLEPLSPLEYRYWQVDCRINHRGAYLNTDFLDKCIQMHGLLMQRYQNMLTVHTQGRVPSAGSDKEVMLEAQRYGHTMDGNNKASREDVLTSKESHDQLKYLINIINNLKKTSCSKFYSMRDAICEDGRIRGLMVYFGAMRTGRWAARLVQLQNMTGNADLNEEMYEILFDLINRLDVSGMMLLFGWGAMDALSWCVRPCIQAAPGKELVDADYSAIEARVLAWGAGEQWRIDFFNLKPWTWIETKQLYAEQLASGQIKEGQWPFKDGKRLKPDIYIMSYSSAFGVPYQQVTKKMRKIGKVQELALGYFGGVGAMLNFGADKLGMSEAEMNDTKNNWRKANPAIKQFWFDMDRAAINAVMFPGKSFEVRDKATFYVNGPYLHMRLPSGRTLKYYSPSIKYEQNQWTGEMDPKLYYWGRKSDEGGKDESKKWCELSTYGGKLVENWTQAVSRDITAYAVYNLDKEGYSSIFHVHDEIVNEEDEGYLPVSTMIEIMCDLPSWAVGLPVNAAGWSNKYFMKD